jgi:hypothetical protein
VAERAGACLSQLYAGQPFRCGACGLRWALEEELGEHVAGHARDAAAAALPGTRCTLWHLDEAAWACAAPGDVSLAHGMGTDFEIEAREREEGERAAAEAARAAARAAAREEALCVPLRLLAGAPPPPCAVCGEPFEKRFSEAHDEWVLLSAIRSDDGSMTHATCAAPAAASKDAGAE